MCQSLAWIIDLILAWCVCAWVCEREKYWTALSFSLSEHAEGCISLTYCYLLLPLSVSVPRSLLYLPVPPSLARPLLSWMVETKQLCILDWYFVFSCICVSCTLPDTCSYWSTCDNEIILNSSLSVSFSLCLSSSGCGAGTERWGSGKMLLSFFFFFNTSTISAHLNLFSHFAESHCDWIQKTPVLVSSALLLRLNGLQTEMAVCESVVSCLLKSFRGEKKKRCYSPRTASCC